MKLKTRKVDASLGEIFFYAEVDGSGYFGASENDVLDAVAELGDVGAITLYINSFGGDAFAGIAIYQALRRLDAKIHVRVDGVAASAASVIAMAGDEITINRGAMMMVHNASGIAISNKHGMRELADLLEKIDAAALDIYAARPGADREQIRAAMDGEGKSDGTWMSGAEAVALHLADNAESDDGKKPAAKMSADRDSRLATASALYAASAARAAGRDDIARSFISNLTGSPTIQARLNAPNDDQRPAPASLPAQSDQVKDTEAVMSNPIAALQEKRRVLQDQVNKMVDEAAKRDDKGFTEPEHKEMDTLKAEIANIDANIKQYRDAAALDSTGAAPLRQTSADAPGSGAEPARGFDIISKRDSRMKQETGGYQNFGELAQDIYKAAKTGQRSARLAKLAANGYEGEKGGFLLPEAFQEQIVDSTIKSQSLLGRCTSPEIETRSITMPVDEDEAHDTATGLKSGTAGEGKSVAESEIKIGSARVDVVKHEVKTKVTDELLADSRALTAYLEMKAKDKLDFQISDQIFRGNGSSQMLGFLNSGAIVTIAAESAQTADTIVAENIVNMVAALPAESTDKAVWLVSHSLASQIPLLKVKATSEIVYTAPGTFKDKPGEFLQGIPVLKHLACSDKGDLGDIALVDLSQYFAPRLMGGIELRVYDQIGWDDDTIGFKWVFRVGGRPFRSAPSTVKYGSFQISPFVTLAAR